MGNISVQCLQCDGCRDVHDQCGNCQVVSNKKRPADLIPGKTCASMRVLRDPDLLINEESEEDRFEMLQHLQGSWYDEADGELVGSVSGSFIVWNRPWMVSDPQIVTSRMPSTSEGHVALEMDGHVLIGQVCLETQRSIVWNNGQVWLQK